MSERASLVRRFARPWRLAFILYASALTVGTHWPQLTLAPEVPASDKTIHLLAFAGLTYLLWRTRWLRAYGIVIPLAFLWSIVDELSQGIPILNRHVTWEDAAANALGVIVVAAWIRALRPVGGAVNRMRIALQQFAFDRLFASWRAWLLFVGVFLACAVPPLIVRPILDPIQTARVIIIAAVVWFLLSIVLLLRLWRGQIRDVVRTRPCFVCGVSCINVRFDRSGRAACPVCGVELHAGQWTDPTPPSFGMLLGILGRPILLTLIVLLFVFALISVSAHLFEWSLIAAPTSSLAPRIAHFVGTLPPELTRAVDLALCLLLLALATRLYRSRLARYYDRSVRCRRCGHDLRGTPTQKGVGRCGECGTPFVRMSPLPRSEEENGQTTENTEEA
ncbi:MAG: hypothetical protein SYC29_18000 [Planctomycetota bacterium]|nr:hypothetical protein [Planctomycetota bacterium]